MSLRPFGRSSRSLITCKSHMLSGWNLAGGCGSPLARGGCIFICVMCLDFNYPINLPINLSTVIPIEVSVSSRSLITSKPYMLSGWNLAGGCGSPLARGDLHFCLRRTIRFNEIQLITPIGIVHILPIELSVREVCLYSVPDLCRFVYILFLRSTCRQGISVNRSRAQTNQAGTLLCSFSTY